MEKLKELRAQNKMSYNDMAKRLHINKTFYWQIENEQRNLSYNMAVNISKVFNLKPDDIFYNHYKTIVKPDLKK